VEAKLLQTAASLRTFFVLVISAEALKSLVAFLCYWSRSRMSFQSLPTGKQTTYRWSFIFIGSPEAEW